MDEAAVNLLLPALLAAALSAGLIKKFCEPGSRFHWLDRPNERSLHERPTPRTGGIGIMAGAAAGWLLAGMPMVMPFVPALLLAAVSLRDDAKGLPVAVRLVLHLAAAGLYAWSGGFAIELALLVVLATVWMTNLFNFMDGSDGLAGGMAVIGFGWYAIAAGQAGEAGLAGISVVLACASAAFLPFNFSPAKIFMGDSGSIPLGFLAATLGFEGWRSNAWPLSFPLLVFSPFVVDATVTLLRRALRGKKVWQAHREHAYQKLVRLGWSHRRVAAFAYGIMLAAGASAWFLCRHPAQQVLGLGAGAIVYAALLLAVEWKWQRHKRAPQ